MSARPLIGIVLDEGAGELGGFSRRPFYALRKDYFAAVERAGGAPVGVGYGREAFARLLEVCDGWLIPGGDYRFAPEWYDVPPPQALAIATPRGLFEQEAIARIIAADKPLLGICNGMQVIAGHFGARIAFRGDPMETGVRHQSIDGAPVLHRATIEPGSKLATILGVTEAVVNSSHREHLVTGARGLDIVARAEDCGIEALEAPDRHFVIGVQWHPELDGAGLGGAVFAAFVRAAARGEA
jgi:putative glutamine amidotransferase